MRQWENQLIIVGIECNHEGNKRLEEFSPYDFKDFDGQRIHGTGKVFMQWVVDELKPLIDTHFRTKPEREYTGIGGSSMGGLMAYYTVVAHNDVFSKAACISSAVGFCYDAMREELTSAGPLLPDTRVYMSWGSKESGRKPGLVKYTCTNLEFSHLLVERGAVTYPYLQAFGGHCEADWEKQNAIPAAVRKKEKTVIKKDPKSPLIRKRSIFRHPFFFKICPCPFFKNRGMPNSSVYFTFL